MSATFAPPVMSANAADDVPPPAASLTRRADRKLAERLRSGDPRALEDVHEQCGPAVFGYLRHMLRDGAAAEDVHQQVFTEVWRRAAQYDVDRGSLATWTLTIARSRAVDELRRRRPEPFDPAELPEPAAPVAGASEDAVLDRWRMAHLLQRLPEEERDLLRLRFYAELTQTEIADRTGVPLGTIKSRMVRGLERLRGLLDEEDRP